MRSLCQGNSIYCNTNRWVMSDDDDLHGQILRLIGITPLAGGGANNIQSLKQDTRGDVAASQFSQLP